MNAQQLSARPPKSHGTNGEFVVFGLMADIETLVVRHLGRGFSREAWPLLEQLFNAHLAHRQMYLGDLLISISQSNERTMQCIQRLSEQGLLDIGGENCGDGLTIVNLSARGADIAATLADELLLTITEAYTRAGLDPFARPRQRRRSLRHSTPP